MKKNGYLILISSLLFLTACGNTDEVETTEENTASATVKQETPKEDELDEKDVGNGLLENVGEYSTVDGAKVSLLAIHRPEGIHKINDNLAVTIKDIKLMELSEIQEESFYAYDGYIDGDKMLQVVYMFDNQSNSTVDGIATPKFVTSDGEQFSPTSILENYEVLPNANAQTGFVQKINNTDFTGITLHWELFEDNPELGYQPIETQPLEINF